MSNVTDLATRLSELKAAANRGEDMEEALWQYSLSHFLDQLYFDAAAIEKRIVTEWQAPLDPDSGVVIKAALHMVFSVLQQQARAHGTALHTPTEEK